MDLPLEQRLIEFLSPRGRRLAQLSYGRGQDLWSAGGRFESFGTPSQPVAARVPHTSSGIGVRKAAPLSRPRLPRVSTPASSSSLFGRKDVRRVTRPALTRTREGRKSAEERGDDSYLAAAAPYIRELQEAAPVGSVALREDWDEQKGVGNIGEARGRSHTASVPDAVLCAPTWSSGQAPAMSFAGSMSNPEGLLLGRVDSQAARLAEEMIAMEDDELKTLAKSLEPAQVPDVTGTRKQAARASAGRLARVFEEGRRQGEMALVERLRDLEETHDAEMRSAAAAVQLYEEEIETELAREQHARELETRKQEEAERVRKEAAAARQVEDAAREQRAAALKEAERQRAVLAEKQRQQSVFDARRTSLDVSPGDAQHAGGSSGGTYTDAQQAAAPFLSALAEAERASDSVKADRSLAVGRMMLVKSIQTAITQISATDAQVRAKISDLDRALQSARNSALYDFAVLRTAQRLVSQADSQIYLHPSSAFPVAAVGLALCANHSRLHKLLLGCLYTSCPYLIPVNSALAAGESKEKYLKRLGWVFVEGAPETLEAHYDRMSGFAMLFAALVQTPLRPRAGASHPFGVDLGWTWLARTLNSEPSRITSLLLASFLEIAGYRMTLVYGAQFRKLLQLLAGPYAARLPKTSSGSNARLSICVGKLLEPSALARPPEGWSSYLL